MSRHDNGDSRHLRNVGKLLPYSVKAVFFIFFRLQVKRKDRNLRPGPGLRLAQPGGTTAMVSVLPFYLKTEEDPASET
jgi:hypothetical protein